MALTAQTVHVMVTPTAADKHAIDGARYLPLLKPVSSATPLNDKPEDKPQQGDFKPLIGAGQTSFDPATSKESGRSDDSVEYVNKNGSHSVVLSQTPLSVADGHGGWTPMDTRVVDKPNAKAGAARDGAHAQFAPTADDAKLLEVDSGQAPVTLALDGAKKVKRAVKDSTVTYPEALTGIDLQYTVEVGAVKEALIVKNAKAIGEGRWAFTLGLGDGLTPSLEGDHVLITNAQHVVVAALPAIEVFDSANKDSKDKAKTAAHTGGKYSLARKGDSWSLTVSVDKGWLIDKKRVFPITVDPTYTYGFGTQPTSFAYRSDGAATCQNTCGIAVGNSLPNGQNLLWRSGFRFDFTPVAGKTVVGARLDIQRTGSTGTANTFTSTISKATNPLGYTAIGDTLASGPIGDTGSMQSKALTDFIAAAVSSNDSNAWLMLTGNETSVLSYKQLKVQLVIDYGTAAPESAPAGPVDDAVLTTLTPTLQTTAVTNPSGDATQYCFKVSTGVDGRSGSVVDSGCLDTPTWTVPKYVLHDGGVYTWTVDTTIKGGATLTPAHWVRHFRVDQRIGDPGPVPTDDAGSVRVNLVNGNAHTEVSGPGFTAVGGSAGVKFAYNSQSGEGHGMRASYFNDPQHNGTPGNAPVLVRGESQVNLNWSNPLGNSNGNLDPGALESRTRPPALAPDFFVVRWEGYFQADNAADYQFTGVNIDGAKIWVGNTLVYDHADRFNADPFQLGLAGWSNKVTLKQNQRVALKVELYHKTLDPALMQLWVQTDPARPQLVTTDSLYTQDASPLPPGWTLGTPGSGYTHAELLDSAVVLTDTAGGVHAWARTPGGYAPPPDEDGVLAFDAAGQISVTENGVVSVFNNDGTLAAVSTVLDSKKPAALQYVYSGTTPRLTKIQDPVSGRAQTLYYNTDNSDSCYGGTSKPAGATSAPQGKLCRIVYWDGSQTRLWYDRLTLLRIENPGGEVTDFAYLKILEQKVCHPNPTPGKPAICTTTDAIEDRDGPHGPLAKIRTPLVNDWIAAQGPFSLTSGVETALSYLLAADIPGNADSEKEKKFRTTAVSLPPTNSPLATRAQRSYAYDFPGHQAAVNVAGLSPQGGFYRKVTWDDAGRGLTDTNADGVTRSTEWNAKDKVTADIDPAGRRSTTVYDYADRPVDLYGPAPASCFNGLTPTAACAASVPHTRNGYDEGIAGLQTAFYDNPSLSGVPKIWQTGIGTPDGSLAANWGPTPPVANTGGWSGRFTGEIQFPAVGAYGVGFTTVDGVRMWLDDVLVVDSWTDKASTAVTGSYNNAAAGSWHRIRVEYYNHSGNTGALNFTWTPPGAGTVTTPGQVLRPRYGLVTSKIDYDTSRGNTQRAGSTKTATTFSDPASGIDPVYGLVVAKTSDPDGASLTRRLGYESPGNGYMRLTSTALPSGDISNPDKRSTTTYYGVTETRSNPCDAASPAVNQAGLPKITTAAKNAAGQANTAETVYDASGRVVASRVNSEPWSCASYDARSRLTRKSFPAMGAQPARTVTYNYSVNNDPLTTSVTDASGTITTAVDILGRGVSYTDANGVVTATVYDAAGRVSSIASTIKGITSTLNYTWDDASRLLTVGLDGTTVATPHNDNAGELQNVAYGNGSRLDSITRDDTGAITARTWKASNSSVTDAVTRSWHGRITDENLTDTANPGTTFADSYTYDSVGRLVAATVPHHQLTYSFDAAGGCGPNATAGNDTNRTGFTDIRDGSAPAVTHYCYDNTDRLLSTNGDNALSFVYDGYGNATKVGTDTLGYDSTRRHISSTTAAGTNVAYTRDANDRLVARIVQGASTGNGTTRYAYASPSESNPEFVLNGTGNLLQRVVKLPAGVLLTKTYGQSPVANWSYPSIHGSVLFTADRNAVRTGTLHIYDPYGQDIDPATGAIGDIPIPATMQGGMDLGYLGEHTIPIEHLASQQTLEMGVRTYLPTLGRFLQTDPVAAGSANDYDYVNADPVNNLDVTGNCPECVIQIIEGAEALVEDLTDDGPNQNKTGTSNTGTPPPNGARGPECDTCGIYVAGNTKIRPKVGDRGDIDVDSNGMVHPPSVTDLNAHNVQGKSAFESVEAVKNQGLNGKIISPNRSLPAGLGIIADDEKHGGHAPPGHLTIYPTRDMTLDEMQGLVDSMDWVVVDRNKKGDK
ncbi:PA14 domain-containing protein [Nocardia sp. NPDC052001]|uniref:PA14 domain-containing protein n=1 Tax=Nocardia sp. NPDC052001 TaxID=3154853 RepID=UPI003416FF8B